MLATNQAISKAIHLNLKRFWQIFHDRFFGIRGRRVRFHLFITVIVIETERQRAKTQIVGLQVDFFFSSLHFQSELSILMLR